MWKKMRIARRETLFILALLALAGAIALLTRLPSGAGGRIEIRVNGALYKSAALAAAQSIDIDQGDMHNTLTIENGTARMTQANCPGGDCLHQTLRAGSPIICLPHRVVVTLVSGAEAAADAVSE